MTPDRLQRLRATLDQRQPDLTVITDEVNKTHNISAILRTCDAVGIQTLHAVVPEGEAFRTFHGRAGGSQRWVDVRVHRRISQAIQKARDEGMQIVATHLSGDSRPYYQLDFTRPTALVMGAEKKGVSPTTAALADANVIIPMHGMVESYNVSVAAAIILQEAQRQRQAAGLYDGPSRLPLALREELFFRWAHPKVAAFCHENDLAYPPLDDEGEIIEPAAWYRRAREGGEKMRSWKGVNMTVELA